MPLFAILDTEKGAFLPGGGRGGTWREPDENKPPRLFTKKAHADAALRWWLNGPGCRSGGLDLTGDYWEEDFCQGSAEKKVAAERQARAHFMKVVEVKIELL